MTCRKASLHQQLAANTLRHNTKPDDGALLAHSARVHVKPHATRRRRYVKGLSPSAAQCAGAYRRSRPADRRRATRCSRPAVGRTRPGPAHPPPTGAGSARPAGSARTAPHLICAAHLHCARPRRYRTDQKADSARGRHMRMPN